MVYIGIDLGTTYSCVSVIENGRPVIIYGDDGKRSTPSAVAYSDLEILVGSSALNCPTELANVLYDSKRLIGWKYRYALPPYTIDRRQLWTFNTDFRERAAGYVLNKGTSNERFIRPEEVTAEILKQLKLNAERYLNEPITGAVVTIPAQFNEDQIKATKIASQLAEIELKYLLYEPTAAAIAYNDLNGLEKSRMMIFDFGGGKLDISIIETNDGKYEIKALAGDPYLGGEDIDERIMNYVINEFEKVLSFDITEKPRSIMRLRNECRLAKEALSFNICAFNIHLDLNDIEEINVELSQEKFNEICNDLFEKAMMNVNDALTIARLDYCDIDYVVLVGGSTRILKIKQLLCEKFGYDKIKCNISPDEAVAYGAAIIANAIELNKCDIPQNISSIEQNVLAMMPSYKNNDNSLKSVEIARNKKLSEEISKQSKTSKIISLVSSTKKLITKIIDPLLQMNSDIKYAADEIYSTNEVYATDKVSEEKIELEKSFSHNEIDHQYQTKLCETVMKFLDNNIILPKTKGEFLHYRNKNYSDKCMPLDNVRNYEKSKDQQRDLLKYLNFEGSMDYPEFSWETRTLNDNNNLPCIAGFFYLNRLNRRGLICRLNFNNSTIECYKQLPIPSSTNGISIDENFNIFLLNSFRMKFQISNILSGEGFEGLKPKNWNQQACVATYKDKLYLIGGKNERLQEVDDVYVYTIENNEWKPGPKFPIKISNGVAIVCDDKLYVIDDLNSGRIYRLSGNDSKWIEIGKFNNVWWSSSLAVLDNKIYRTPGREVFDPNAPEWDRLKEIADMTFSRQEHSLVALNEKLYAVGGYRMIPEKGGLSFCEEIEQYDPIRDEWKTIGYVKEPYEGII